MGFDAFLKGYTMADQEKRNALRDEITKFGFEQSKSDMAAPEQFLGALKSDVTEEQPAPATPQESTWEGLPWTGVKDVARPLNGNERLIKLMGAVAKNPRAASALGAVAKLDPVLGPQLRQIESESEYMKGYAREAGSFPIKSALNDQKLFGNYMAGNMANQQKYQLAKDLFAYKENLKSGGTGAGAQPKGIIGEVKYMLDQFKLPFDEENVSKMIKIRHGVDVDAKVLFKVMDAINKKWGDPANVALSGMVKRNPGESDESYFARIEQAKEADFDKTLSSYTAKAQGLGGKSSPEIPIDEDEEDYDDDTVDTTIGGFLK